MARTTPCVREAQLVLSLATEDQHTITVGSTDWYRWLSHSAQRSFAFGSSLGTFTARKERKQKGGWYWVAYRQVQGTLYKFYLGKSENLSLDRLLLAAATLAQRAELRTQRRRAPQHIEATPLIATKLVLPPARLKLLPRQHLFARLEEGLTRPLTLLCAPAGFGKTTLLSGWLTTLAERGVRVAWVSLDAQDNDPVRFWSYVLTALNQAAPGCGIQALALLSTTQPPLIQSVLTSLINALAREASDLVLALDDYQVIETPAIREAMSWLLQHLPPCLHLALASRANLPFALPRLRVLGQSLELRADDLRFTLEETATFLTQVIPVDLAREDMALLEARTEGWIAGLQLAALSLQGRQDKHSFLTSFSGSQSAIREYLVEEVLLQQPEAVQAFLLQTSVLERLNGPLCEAVSGHDESQAMLLQVERANLFLHPLDEERRWYRYHSLFADALRAHLQLTQPRLPPLLHQRAAAWYLGQGYPAEAIEHALAIPDYEGAVHLISQQARTILMAGQLSTLLRWLQALPNDIVRAHSRLSLVQAWALLFTGQLHAALARLQELISSCEPTLLSEYSAVQNHPFIDDARAISRMLNAFHGNSVSQDQWMAGPVERQDGKPVLHSLVALSLGFQAADQGDENCATQWLLEAIRLSISQDDLLVSVLALSQLAEVHLVQGHLHQAAAYYRQALRLATGPDRRPLPIAGIAYVGIGLLLREWNNLEAAEQHLQTGIELCRRWAEVWALDGYLALARVYTARGQQEAAHEAIREAERIAPLLESEVFVGHVAMTQVRLDLLQGQIQAATRWAGTANVRLDAEVRAEDEPRYLLWARVLLAQGASDTALHLVIHLLPGIEAAGRHGRLIELLALQALALYTQKAIPQAIDVLERALALAAPESYARLFVELGAPMAALLRHARARQILPDYIQQLLDAFGTAPAPNGKPSGTSLPDPLTTREGEVLRLLAAGASNRAIAEELVITVGTVKKHLHNVFHKLQVVSRTQAIATARTLGLD